jgi:hypothetical protein
MELYERLRIDESEIGKTFGTRTQIGAMFSIRTDYGEKRRVAVCECQCGRTDLVQRKHRNRLCQRCKAVTHGLADSPEFGVWQGMVRRCHDARSKDYARYGGRGIIVCEEWRDSFAAFYEYMGPRPHPKLQIDRINNDGPYAPGNCRWVTASVNQRNKGRKAVGTKPC